MKALLIPAGELDEPKIVEITPDKESGPALDEMGKLVGGWPCQAKYDRDSVMYVDEDGIAKHRIVNREVTDYILTESDAARQGRMEEPGGYALYGDVVIVGEDGDGIECDVPQRLVGRFMSIEQTPERGDQGLAL